jgi:dienelactone hydrolase
LNSGAAMILLALLLAAAPAPSALAGPLDYKDTPYEDSVTPEPGGGFTVRFPSPVKSPFPKNDVVWAHYWAPSGPGPHPCIVVLPVMAAPNVWIETRFINRFKKDGFAVLWLEMPYQFNRRPHTLQPSGQAFLARTAKRLAFNFRQSVLDSRRALSWLKRRPEIDAQRVGVFGVSLGAIVGAAVYSVDPMPRYAVLLLGGANFPTLVTASSLSGPWVKKMALKPEAVVEAWKDIDPTDYTAKNAGKPVLLINARGDTVIPAANALRLKDAFPAAKQLWVPLGHYTAIVHLTWIPRYVSRIFAENLVKKR